MALNNITITYASGQTHVTTDPLYQGDYEQQITFVGIPHAQEIVQAYLPHFMSCARSNTSLSVTSSDGARDAMRGTRSNWAADGTG